MPHHTFGEDTRHLSWVFDLVIDHFYTRLMNKISGTSLEQLMPNYFHDCWRLLYSALGDGALHKTKYVDVEVQHEICWCMPFNSTPFGLFVCLFNDFGIPTAHPGSLATRHENF